jgi:hypothetical protein
VAKEKRTAQELARMVIERLSIEGVSVTVLKDVAYGWNGWAMTAPGSEPDIHVKMQLAVEELRKRYDLQE